MFNKYTRFHDWCNTHGVIQPKIHYPGRFENGVVGLECVDAIEYHESYLYVPYKLTLTTQMADEHPKLKQIIESFDIFHKTAKEPD